MIESTLIVETWFDKAAHITNLLLSGGILIGILKQYGIIKIAKDRFNKVWYDYCEKHDIPYESLDGK